MPHRCLSKQPRPTVHNDAAHAHLPHGCVAAYAGQGRREPAGRPVASALTASCFVCGQIRPFRCSHAMSLPRSNTASAAVPTSRDEQLKMLFARLARPVAHTAASAASSSAPPSLRLPLSSLPDALRCLGLRLMTEDVDDIVAAAAPFAPLSLSHFAHFVAQAQQQGRHNEEADVSEAFNEMAAACNNASATAAAGRSPRGQAGANDIALSDLHRLLTTQGDALSPEEWQRYLRTIGGDSSGTASAATTALISPSKDRRRVRVGEVM